MTVQTTTPAAEPVKEEPSIDAKDIVEEPKKFEDDSNYLDDVIRILRRNSGNNF